MAQAEELDSPIVFHRSTPWKWLLQILVFPGRTMKAVAKHERSVWGIPLILLTLLTIVHVLVAAPLRQQEAMNNMGALPDNYQYMSPEQQEQYNQAQQSKSSTAMTTIFPGISALIGLWLGWFILGGVLHLVLTLLGSRSTTITAYNLAGWASLPFVIRLCVQIGAMLINQRLISSPGISGFIASDSVGVWMFIRVLLSMVDIYLIWQVVLLVVGATSTPGLTRIKAWGGVLSAVLVLLALSSLPGFIFGQLSGLDVSRSFFFF